MSPKLQAYTAQISKICQEDGISYLALFGSFARGEQKQESDVDVLVQYKKPVGFFKLYDTQEKLSAVFERKIDLVTVGGLKKHLRPYIEPDLKVLYEVA